jgi:hypothetical protein
VADLVLLAAISCLGVAGLLAFLRTRYYPAPIPRQLEQPWQGGAFLGSIVAMLIIAMVMLLWWGLQTIPGDT